MNKIKEMLLFLLGVLKGMACIEECLLPEVVCHELHPHGHSPDPAAGHAYAWNACEVGCDRQYIHHVVLENRH